MGHDISEGTEGATESISSSRNSMNNGVEVGKFTGAFREHGELKYA